MGKVQRPCGYILRFKCPGWFWVSQLVRRDDRCDACLVVGKALRHITLGSELSSKSRGEARYFLGMRRPRLVVSNRLTSGDKYEILGDLPNYRLKSRKNGGTPKLEGRAGARSHSTGNLEVPQTWATLV